MPLTAILETCLYAPSLDEAEAFYGGVMGLEKRTREGNRHVFFSCGQQMLLIFNPTETVIPPGAGKFPVPTHGAHGPGHVCFVAEPDGIDAWRERLTAAGIAIEADFSWPNGARSIYFRDPAGNSVEIAERRLWFAAD